MGDALEESFSAEVGSDARTASRLASLARSLVPPIAGSADDSDEDLVLRLRDPRTFGEFAASLLDDRTLSRSSREGIADHAFDLLPLPRAEGEIILVEGRAPERLLLLARFLAETRGLTVLHVMHLVFAVFLDRSLVRRATPEVRSSVLAAVVAVEEASVSLRSLYAAIHLAAVSEREAERDFRGLLARNGNTLAKASLAELAAADDRGVAILLQLAREEGLVPADSTDPTAPEVIANLPRLPQVLGPIARRWLAATK